MPERETKDSLLISKATWNKDTSQQNDVNSEPSEHSNGNQSTVSIPDKIEDQSISLTPKVRPFDPAFFLSNAKPKKQTGMTNYLHTGEMLKYLDNLMDTLPDSTKRLLVSSYYQFQGQMPDSNSNSYTAVDTLSYAEVARHLTSLRTEHVQRFIRPVLQRLLLHPRNVGNLFNKPVDPVLLELPDYFTRIRRPMDLGTVKSRLQRGFYRSIESVTSDINLVFKNAISYNASNHDINLIAKTMRSDFEVDMLALEDKCARETDRKGTHSCTLCQEASCPLCGEKCLKFDPPVLVCHGTCLQKVKKNSVYYVTVDGIMLWCQRCYTGLPTVILELPSRPPLLKRNLLKRRLDEEVAEPWVSCDTCGHWFHQICALYNDRMSVSSDSGPSGSKDGVSLSGGSSTCTNPRGHYECPLCKLEAMQQQCSKQIHSHESNHHQNEQNHVSDPDTLITVDKRRKRYPGTACEADETTFVSKLVERGRQSIRRPPLPVAARAETRSRAGAAKIVPNVSSQPQSQDLSTTFTKFDAISALNEFPALNEISGVKPGAVEIDGYTGSGNGKYNILSSSLSSAATSSLFSSVDVTDRDGDVDEIMDVSEDGSVTTNTICSDKTLSLSSSLPGWERSAAGKRDRDRDDFADGTVEENSLPAHLNQWRASTLPRSHLGDFLEALVSERLRSCGFEEAADTVTVRMTSNVEQYMEVPLTIIDNLRTSEGLCVPPYLAYKQKCILLFQKVDGVDICLFCLYVQEFDEKCPEPNKSVVYIAYLDSVDFFRPMEARTLVYQEVLVGYFKWAQMRGFKQGHIWSCPPQRGDNFIFWCHPPYQRTPSRDRLNAWYNSILLRCSKLGVLEEVGTLWSACFSGYGRRESSGRKDKLGEEPKNQSATADIGTVKDNFSPSPSYQEIFSAGASGSSSSSSNSRNSKADSTTAAGGEPEDAPVCPPVFEGDYWVTECLRVHRLMMGRSKGCDGQDRGVNQRKCRDLLKDLMSRQSSNPFSRPVDIVKLGIPDYPTVVTHPMDLGTVRDQLRLRYYKSILHFAEDVRLTFRNALKYNPLGHPINVTARLLSLEFESCLVELLSEYVGAVPKAENIDKYLDSYPIADSIPLIPVSIEDPPLDHQVKAMADGSKIPPLELQLTDGSIPRGRGRGRGRRKLDRGLRSLTVPIPGTGLPCHLETVAEDGDSSVSDHTPIDRVEGDLMATPQLCRADSFDSMQSCNSVTNENSSICDDNDSWTPRLLFAPTALSGPMPRPSIKDVEAERKAFEKPSLGFKGAMALMSEISKSVFRLKEDLFVIKFTPSVRSRDKSLRKRSVSNQSLNDELEDVLGVDRTNPPPCGMQSKADLVVKEETDTGVVDEESDLTVRARVAFSSKSVTSSQVCADRADESVVDTEVMKQEAALISATGTTEGDNDLDAAAITLNLRINRKEEDRMDMSGDDARTMLTESFASMIHGQGQDEGQSTCMPAIASDSSYWAADVPLDTADSPSSSVSPLATVCDTEGVESGVDQNAILLVPSSIPPLLPIASVPITAGRRGREAGTRRTSHQKKSKGPKGRNRRRATVPVSIVSDLSDSISAALVPPSDLSIAAAVAVKTKGGKAGAYLRRLGERDQGGQGEVDCEEEFSEHCLSLLTGLVPDTTDPDTPVKCPFVDSRHTFLEMCQFRHYQFDSLRRAKHSSLMLLYHLHFPDNLNARPTCACCKGAIRDVRWHCDQCADFDVCDACYQAAEAEIKSESTECSLVGSISKRGKEGSNLKREQPLQAPSIPVLRLEKHSHPLTPFRITYI